ncbi:phosphoglycerate mutase-like protein [Lindgomyces ingoldianus]|uniref:Phosphoglycerate mutase-like protein n=1 Tax=Lindgomyces ingoldianus TaxID=673940 RepID=A0ACB6Q9T3_9PLEO|nr:phosphoglycerate mutase-like protein [Lindgomyces ingoldianus]KAF2463343.1 phosphoglycerate mutase-like protein [Lindgomyces ingoldianus]
MLALFLALMAAAWLIDAADDMKYYQPWGAVVYTRTGERTPILRGDPQILSAVGAQQMYKLGQNFRGRYINALGGHTGLGQEPIQSLSPDLINSNQLKIMTLDTPYLVASAQAFLQGLYPPYTLNSTRAGLAGDATGILANNSVIDFPMGGYQYPQIEVAGEYDPNGIYLGGDQSCPLSSQESMMYLTTKQFLNTQTLTKSFYEAIDASYFDGHLAQDKIDYINAVAIYDYLSYGYVHDSQTYKTFANDSTYAGVYDQLRYLADEQAWYYWGNTSQSTSDNDTRAMAGKTISALILGQFQKIVTESGNSTNGKSHLLSLFFGEHEPFISLFSLMELDFINENFRSIPPFASSMVFELFSMGSGNDPFPSDPQDLWIRFYFQNGTDFKGSLQAYPMFGRGPSGTDMPWLDFQNMMSRIMTNTLQDWCGQCSSGALFCWGVDNSTINIITSGSQSRGVTPTVAGVIGAVVTLAVAGILFALAMLIGGIRFHRVQPSKKSELGGFKGSAKLASDPDLHLAKNGVAPAGIVSLGASDTKRVAHERVGSWELRQKEFGPGGAKSGDLGDESRRGSFEAIEAAMSKPVQPDERV